MDVFAAVNGWHTLLVDNTVGSIGIYGAVCRGGHHVDQVEREYELQFVHDSDMRRDALLLLGALCLYVPANKQYDESDDRAVRREDKVRIPFAKPIPAIYHLRLLPLVGGGSFFQNALLLFRESCVEHLCPPLLHGLCP